MIKIFYRLTVLFFYIVFIYSIILGSISKTEMHYLNMAENLFKIGKYKEAIKLYDTVINMDNQNALAYVGKGNCYVLMGKEKKAEIMYKRARELNPEIEIPDLTKYIEIQNQRGKNIDKIREKYWKLFGKKNDEKIEILPDVNDIKKENTKQPILPEKQDLKITEKKDSKDVKINRKWWYRGGYGKMLSLGDIEFIYPDLKTAMDGYGNGITAGLLFRENIHFFNLEPCYGFYSDIQKYLNGSERNYQTMFISTLNSIGEISWPTNNFVNKIIPMFLNSNKIDSEINLPDYLEKNTGNLFGGIYTAGFKPLPILGIAGSVGYIYSPYTELTNNGSGDENITIKATQLYWDVGGGLFLPFIINNEDEFDITISFSPFSPDLELTDLNTQEWFNLPYSFFNNYTIQIVEKTEKIDPSGLITSEDSLIREGTGYTIKGNLHYMYGNSLHEFFAFFEAPYDIRYTIQGKHEEKLEGVPEPLSSTTTDKITLLKERQAIFKTGIRDNFKYFTFGAKYEYKYRETYYETTITPITGKEIEKKHKIITGINITPVDIIKFPVEFVYKFNNLINVGNNIFTTDMIIKGGLEIMLTPFFSIRGGMSYEFLKEDGNGLPSSGTENNQYINYLGYHFGTGIDMSLFEINLGGAYKKIYPTPQSSLINDYYTYLMLIFLDINVYI